MLAQEYWSVYRHARHSAHRAVGVKRFGLPYQQNIDLTDYHIGYITHQIHHSHWHFALSPIKAD
jgi:hypothetical protein